MNRDRSTGDDERRDNPERPSAARPAKTPGTDMQAEDAGTAASGNEGDPQTAMKQEHKTPSESGGRG